MNGMSMMIPAGGETSASRDNRLMNDAIMAAGRRLPYVSYLLVSVIVGWTYGDARKVSRSRKNLARYLTCMTCLSSSAYSFW